jgi:hypothetical protein
MESFDDRLKPENVENFEQYKVEHYLHFVRQEVSEFLFNNIDKSYYEFFTYTAIKSKTNFM